MLFSSQLFLFRYLPIFLGVYFALYFAGRAFGRGGLRLSHAWILLASLFFYAWGELELVLVMLFSTAVNYASALAIRRAQREEREGKAWLVLGVATNLAMLAFFKYADFGLENIRALFAAIGAEGLLPGEALGIALPLGISFYTFQSLSYTIDVYERQVDATDSFLDFACYVTMFPQLVAGPIVRYIDVAAQLQERSVRLGQIASGAQRFTIGLAKKVLIANTVAVQADMIFELQNEQLSFAYAWIGAIAYTLQIYFDFSGYSDMAIGLGRMMGFSFPENFNYPYVARSNQDFWRRWHISLSTWFRDYLYIPLGGNRVGAFATYRNLALVFFLCGLWHGASWTFVIWGVYHGAFLIAERRGLGKALAASPRVLQHVYAMLVAIAGWILFRAETLDQAGAFFAAMVGLGVGETSASWTLSPEFLVAACLGIIFSIPIVPAFLRAWSAWVEPRGLFIRLLVQLLEATVLPAVVIVLFHASVAALAAGTHNPFIYFRF